MTQKGILPVYKVFTAVAIAAPGAFSSAISNILYKDDLIYQFQWTGTLTGTFQVWCSVDYNPGLPQSYTLNGPQNGTWNVMPCLDLSSNPPIAAGAAGVVTIDLTLVAAPYIYVTYTNTAGAGTLDGLIFGKSVGL